MSYPTHDRRSEKGSPAPDPGARVDLYWLPLGSGNRVVQTCGRVYERFAARRARREPADLYHSALEVHVPGGRFIVEQTPVQPRRGESRGVVAQGPVGLRWAGVLRVFRYELRCWPDGVIPDIAACVGGPQLLATDPATAHAVLAWAPRVPTPVWGRDELRTGEMWNSNSIVAWLVTRAGVDVDRLHPPPRGRAPGWNAGVIVARRAM